MVTVNDVSRSQLLSDLHKFGQSCEYERALKTANKVLHHFPEDVKTFQYRIVSLIQLSRFEDALTSMVKSPKLAKSLHFEKAYCQYRLNQSELALETINSAEVESLRLKELKAQVYYRLERFEECFDVYNDIMKNTNDVFDEERQTNIAAVVANICLSGKKMEMPAFENETYELSYNIASQLIGKGLYLEAERKLKYAEKICRESYDEDTLADEIEDEVAIIRVQQAYCMHMQGREKEAQAIYNSTLKQKPNDVVLVAIASNNTAAINGDQNLFDSKKKLKTATTDIVQNKLTSHQKKVIAINNCLLNIYTSQGDQALDFCDRLIEKNPEACEEGMLMKAVLLMKDNKKKEAIQLLKTFSETNAKLKLTMNLAMVELLLSEGELNEACTILENLGNDTFKPGIVSALVTLHLALGKAEEASKILQKAVNWLQKNKTTTGDLSALWQHAADLHLRGGKPEVAAKSLEELLKLNPNDSTILAKLIIAYAQFDPSKAKSLSSQLPNMVDLTPNIDIDTLEASNWLTGLKFIKRVGKGDPPPGTPSTDKIVKKKKQQRKKRRGKLPKNYDPNCDPDPERWLPRHERSTFRKKKDRRNRDIGKGTQGAATHSSDQYDITKMASTQKPGNSQASPVPDSLKHQQRKVQHKKKKKGVKW